MMRRIAVVGDKLDNDGEICHYNGMMFTLGNAGRQAALINGTAYCPVCKTTGFIAKDGGPRRMTLGTSEIALDKDVVVCDCPEHPRISAKLSGEAWYDDLAESLGRVEFTESASVAVSSMFSEDFDEQVRASATEGALEDYPYLIEMADGRTFAGRAARDGILPRMMSGSSADDYTVFWGDDALARSSET